MTTVSRVPARALAWEALGTYVHLATGDPGDLVGAGAIAAEVLDHVDRTCSRFRDDSDLSRVNAHPGEWVAVDPLLVAATTVALQAADMTDGLVDPCLGRSLVALGYDVTMSAVRERDPRTFTVAAAVVPRPEAWREIRVDPAGALRIPADCALDLGATAKAWAADLVAAAVVDNLGGRVLVSLGGDLRIDGAPGGPWPVRVTELPDEAAGETITLSGGGLATSSTRARRWRTGDVEQHHLLDPRTGRPVAGPWRTVTATGPTSVAANVATTAALVLGETAVGWLREHGVTARLVADDGSVTRLGDWPAPTPTIPTQTERRM
jgi:thiamine biosynthesis lipoprotein